MLNHTAAPDGAIEYKGEGDDPVTVVTAALDDFKGEVIGRLEKVEAAQAGAKPEPETKGADKLVERLDKIEAKLNRPATSEKKVDELSLERKAFGTYLRHGDRTPADELKTLTVSSDPQGGYLAPAEMSTEFIRNLVEFSPIRTVASIRTTGAPSVMYPARTGVTNAKWKGETQTSEASEPGFGQVEIPVREINTFVPISNQLLADSGGGAEAEMRLALAEDFGKKEGAAFLTGDGVLQPAGLLRDTRIGSVATGHAVAITPDGLIDLMYSLPAAYRMRGTWMMNGKSLASIRRLKDAQGQFLWQQPLAAGQPESILGRPVLEAVDMPDIGAGAIPIVFGDFNSGYRIIDRVDMTILVNPYSRATDGITLIHATRRVGGAVIQPQALAKQLVGT
ncbi:phage major capsid protein [Xanthobacter autotrophicus]|uniref:phage major capsid protein n=1 Tax=Xanthobacter TaxID=279 RepID=UPI0024AA2855|nr:phage major capsid protein [Xanthobacter autotrophicus]MDI4664541.1 phage major capsid protein [Xanthobacter autotrophicus]